MLALVLIAVGGAELAVAYPGLYRQALAYIPSGASIREYFVPARPVVTLDDGAPSSAPTPRPPAATVEPAIAPRPVVAPVPAKKPPVRSTQKAASAPDVSSHEGDFSAKVLQPDGTLKEQIFSAKPRRR